MSNHPTEKELLSVAGVVRAATETLVMLSDLIQKAIDALDRHEADADLEDDGNAENTLGAPNPTFPSLAAHPAIAVLSRSLSQENWSAGAHDEDREAEHDGREGDSAPTDQG